MKSMKLRVSLILLASIDFNVDHKVLGFREFYCCA